MNRYSDTKKAGIVGILANMFLLLIKGFIGFMTSSQAMIADAVNSAGDIFASLMTFIGNKIASEPQDKTHNFGHGKAEYVFSFLISIAMILVSIKILYNSAMTLITGTTLKFSWLLVIICIITIITKFILYLYTKKLYKKYDNILLLANMKDHKNDCIVTTFTLISVLLTLANIFWFDGVVGIGISLWICYTGIKIFIESYNVLMDISLDDETFSEVIYIANSFEQIKKVDNVLSTPVGYQYMVFVTISVDGNLSTFESHELADSLECSLQNLDKVYKAVVHVNPV